MTDLHTHILPAVDDGSQSVAESLRMLAAEREQGVETVYLTPHFYPEREPAADFLRRRAKAFDALRAALPEDAPQLCLGAEVAWYPTGTVYPGLERMCLGESSCVLLELPFQPWNARLLDRLYQLTDQTGLTPVLAHVERYLPIQDKAVMRELFGLGMPMQMNASGLLSARLQLTSLLKKGCWALGSDCHNLDTRSPDLGKAAAFLRRKLGPRAEEILLWSPA